MGTSYFLASSICISFTEPPLFKSCTKVVEHGVRTTKNRKLSSTDKRFFEDFPQDVQKMKRDSNFVLDKLIVKKTRANSFGLSSNLVANAYTSCVFNDIPDSESQCHAAAGSSFKLSLSTD